MFERFTDKARVVVVCAQLEARELGHRWIGTEHLLLAMLRPDSGIAYDVLHAAGVDHDTVRADIVRRISTPLGPEDAAALRTIGIDLDEVLGRIRESFGPDALREPPPRRRRGWFRRKIDSPSHLPFSPRAKKTLELSLREALRIKHKHIGTEHILLGLIREGDGLAALVLADEGVDLAGLREATLTALGKAA